MKLREYLMSNRITHREFGKMIGAHSKEVGAYTTGGRMPRPERMKRIAEVTKGAVTANDFYAPDRRN